ncbi:MAG: S8 family serine peptidase [Acidobacteriota bacterium]
MSIVRKVLIALSIVPIALWMASAIASGDDDVSRELVIETVEGGSIALLLDRYGGTLEDSIPEFDAYLVIYPTPAAAQAALSRMLSDVPRDPNLDNAELHDRLEDPEGVGHTVPILDRTAGPPQFRNQAAGVTVRAALAQQSYRGKGVVVAVVDSGIELDHPEIKAQIMRSLARNFAPGTRGAFPDPDGLDNDGDGSIDEATHHGTEVAGLVSLLAPEARIIPIRVLDEDGRGTTFAIAKGILWAIDAGADVINLSMGSNHSNSLISKSIRRADQSGIVIVTASGNRNLGVVDFPCSDSRTICVAAVDNNKVKTSFSSYGNRVDLSAPGLEPLSLFNTNEYANWDGTSFAVPMVSGAAALIIEKYPGLLPTQVRAMLNQSAQPDNNPQQYQGVMGAGVLDAAALVALLSGDRTSLKLEQVAGQTNVKFSPVLGASTYDIVRGQVSALRFAGPSVDLGVVTCLAENTVTTQTTDNSSPPPGAARFYLFRDNFASYGSSSSGAIRQASGGDCGLP